jgi:hypothetical protein
VVALAAVDKASNAAKTGATEATEATEATVGIGKAAAAPSLIQ